MQDQMTHAEAVSKIVELAEENEQMRKALKLWSVYARTYQTATHAQWDRCVRETEAALTPNA